MSKVNDINTFLMNLLAAARAAASGDGKAHVCASLPSATDPDKVHTFISGDLKFLTTVLVSLFVNAHDVCNKHTKQGPIAFREMLRAILTDPNVLGILDQEAEGIQGDEELQEHLLSLIPTSPDGHDSPIDLSKETVH